MRVFLDDQPCPNDAKTVGEAIAACATVAEQRGRYVVEVLVDGNHWTNEQLGSADLTSAVAGEVRTSSAEPVDLVAGTFQEAAEALDDAREIQNDAAALLQRDEQTQAMQRLGEAFTIWISVQQAVEQGSQLVGLDLDQLKVDNQPVQQIISELGEHLRSLRTQIESADHLGVADTLLYELPRVIDQWRGLLDELQQHVRKG